VANLARRQPAPWWGRGRPPAERWPGVSLPFDAEWSTLRRRWETHAGRYYFDPVKAERAESFFPIFLRHHIGAFAGMPFILRADQALLIVRPAFGWRRTVDGLRRFRKIFAFCPKGYGKSPLGAGLGIYLARYDGEPAAEVYAVAADRNQARTVHDNAKIMVENSPDLLEGAAIVKNTITWPAIYSTYAVLSSDAATKHGFRPHGVIFDELHAQKNRDLFEALRKSMAKRDQPLLVIITHAGDDDEGICYEEYDLAKRVLSGNAADLETALPVIFEAAKGEPWDEPAIWRRVNPGHGTTIKADSVAEEAREAAAEPRKRNDFERYHLNRWTNQATAWIPLEWWDDCAGPLEDAALEGLEVAGGLDLAQKWDLAAFVLAFRRYLEPAAATVIDVAGKDEDTGAPASRRVQLNYEILVRPFFWIPENTLAQHEKLDGVPYGLWRELGLVTATEGDVIDYNRIYTDITEQIVPRYPRVKEGTIGYDPAFATDLATKLRDRAGLAVLEIQQNYKMFSEPSQILEALIKGRRVRHDGHRVLRWNWENIAVKTDDAGRIRPVKPRNPAKRIDGAVALIMADRAHNVERPRVPEYQMLVVGG
jgi:phage terminase large subunit-like protein